MTTPKNIQDCLPRLGARYMILACLFALSIGPARANTYLFSFTTSQIMSALQTSQGNAVYSESAYFAIFLQPDPVTVSNYTYVSASSPNPTDTNAWVTNTITDPSSSNLGYQNQTCTANCTWAYFEKAANANTVTLISGANGGTGGQNIFMYGDFWSNSPPPYGWGTTDALIDTIMPGSDRFQFVISTAQTLNGTYIVQGRASSIKSGSASTMTIDTKENDGIPFTLTATLGAPEPGTWAMIGAGALLLGLGHFRRPKAPRRNG